MMSAVVPENRTARSTPATASAIASVRPPLRERTGLLGPSVQRHSRDCDAFELLLQWRKPPPPRNGRGYVYVLPFLVVAGFRLQPLEAVDEIIDEAHEASISL